MDVVGAVEVGQDREDGPAKGCVAGHISREGRREARLASTLGAPRGVQVGSATVTELPSVLARRIAVMGRQKL
jgi:hypothetical protein